MTLEKTLRAIIITGLFAIPFLVLIVSDTMFFPYIVGKNFAFRAIVEIIFVSWALLALLNSEYRPKITPLLVSLLAFVGIVALADLFGENPYKSFWSNYERMEGLVTLLHLLAYTVVWGTILNTEKLCVWFWRVTLAVSIIVSLHALTEYFTTDSSRLASTLGNPIYLAVYVLFHIFVAAILALRRSASSGERFIYGSIIFLELIVLYLTATRGATLGLIGGMLLAAAGIALTERENWQLKKFAASVVLVVLIVVAGFVSMRNTAFVENSPVLSRFAHISLTEGTVMARTYVWGTAWEGVKERPLLGWGQENFNYVFNKYYDPRMYAQEQWFDRTHNIVFDWLIAAGILGFLAYISIFLALLWTLYKMPHGFGNPAQKWLMVGLLGAYSFHSLTVFDNIVSYILFFSIVAWVYAMSQEDKEQAQTTQNFVLSTPTTKFVAVAASVVLVGGFLWFVNADAYRANKTLLGALTDLAYARALVSKDRIEDGTARAQAALLKFEEAQAYNSFGNQEIREQLTNNTSSLLGSKNFPVEVKQQYWLAATKAMQEQKKSAPEDARFPLFLSNIYMSAGMFEQERAELELARKLSPTKQVIIFKQGVNALQSNKQEEALAYFKEAYELDKTFAQAASLYAQALARSGKEQEAEKIINELKQRVTQ